MTLVSRRLARRLLVAVVAVLLFGGWLGIFAGLLIGRPHATITPRAEHGNLLFSPNSQVLATWGKRGGPLQVWDARSGQEILAVDDCEWLETVMFSPDSQLLAGHERKGDLKVWNVYDRIAVLSLGRI